MKRILCLRIENESSGSAGERRAGFSPTASDGELKACPLQAVAARCKQFTPLVGLDPDVFPESVLLDITHVVHLFGGETALVQRIAAELSRRAGSWQLRSAVAHTPSAAWALAGYGGEGKMGRWGDGETRRHEDVSISPSPHLPISPSLISALPLEALRLPEPTVALLHSLGVWQVAQLQALPRRELSSRFGPELLDCLDRVTGRLSEPFPAWNPPRQFVVSWSAEFPTARRETIEAALEHLVRRLAALLTHAGRGAMRLECLLKCAAGPAPFDKENWLQVAVGLFRPTAWANHLAQLLQVRFESLQLPGPLDAIRLVAASTAPLELRQIEMFSEGQKRVSPHHLSGLIDRLSNRLGHTCVMRVRLLPEAQPELACHYRPLVLSRDVKRSDLKKLGSPGAKKAPQKTGPTHLFPPRPLRLLTQPVRLPGGIEGQFSFEGRRHRIVGRVGPERIETGWWRGPAVARDYYRVETATGCCYWIFRQLPAGPWFVHGMFD
jgi:protein ImuB